MMTSRNALVSPRSGFADS
uniref:Uncharacterized protein n=1 Tax=Arundo donax TaxID=35708 RepID=A0A0A9CD73_ARUDO